MRWAALSAAVLWLLPAGTGVGGTAFAAVSSARDAAWSWWTYPQITVSAQNGKAYFGFTTAESGQGVGIYNPSTGRTFRHLFGTNPGSDDHNGVSVSVLPDGRILAVYATGHNKDRRMHVRVSKKAGKVNTWEPEVTWRASGKTTYAQVFQYCGRVYVFYRVRDADSAEAPWAWCMRSSRDLKSWSAEKRIVYAKPQYYCLIRPTTKENLLRIVMTSNPSRKASDFRMTFLDLDTQTLYDTDGKTRIRRLDGTGTNYRDFSIVLKRPDDPLTQRLFDVAVTDPGTLRIAYARMRRTDPASASYYLYEDGKSVKLLKSDQSFWRTYFGGMSFVDSGRLIASCSKKGRDRLIMIRTRHLTIRDKTILTSVKISGNRRLIRPVSAPGGAVIMYLYGYYDPESFRNYRLDAFFL